MVRSCHSCLDMIALSIKWRPIVDKHHYIASISLLIEILLIQEGIITLGPILYQQWLLLTIHAVFSSGRMRCRDVALRIQIPLLYILS